MPIAAFDAKQFRRGRVFIILKDGKSAEKYIGFNSQLGVGVIFSNDSKFKDKYVKKSQELKKSFGIDANLPFFSSTRMDCMRYGSVSAHTSVTL